jgi:tetratricopeptide (TPR) repeat protein
MPDGFDVFLSHNSRDKPVVEEICTLLKEQGLQVWLDKEQLRPGFPWQEGLEEGIQASRAVAVFIGLDGLGAWQEPEARAFIARSRREKIPVIPVLLPGCPESPQLTVFLEAFTWVDLRKELSEDGFARLVWGITGKRPDGKGAVVASAIPRFTASAELAAAGTQVLLVARDLEDHPLAGFRFSYGGAVSRATNPAGATRLDLPPGIGPGQQIKILLVQSSKKTEDWFLVNPQVNIPAGSVSAELVLMRRRDFRQIAAEARDSQGARVLRSDEQLTAEDPKRALIEAASRHGLTVDQLESAIRSFAETQDPKDRGIAAYLEGQHQQAEELLSGAVEKKERDFLETLQYLGATQYQQAKYRAAADSFRKALALRSEDPVLLSWLGMTLHDLADWSDAEQLMRRALDIDEKNYGKEHPKVAIRLNNLAQLLKDTNRLADAEPMMRWALDIDEKSYGKGHPKVAIRLNNLAQLLQATNRLAEAEPMMRRALDIDEKSYGKEHPRVAIRLNNLAQLLKATNRLAEAEPLMRRALDIDEKNYGKEHPNVARDLNNLALLLQATNRLAEAEPMMRRALGIDEKSYGKEHPNVATELNNLALLLKATNRLTEAEPLMRRALDIDERSYGPKHPEVARDLNNLAQLLKNTNRLAEAEQMMRRVLTILIDFSRRTGYEHPKQEAGLGNYRRLLKAMGKSPAKIEESIKALK